MLLITTSRDQIGSAPFDLLPKGSHQYTALEASSRPPPKEEATNTQPSLFGDTNKIKTFRK
jgi:hypothetical protein